MGQSYGRVLVVKNELEWEVLKITKVPQYTNVYMSNLTLLICCTRNNWGLMRYYSFLNLQHLFGYISEGLEEEMGAEPPTIKTLLRPGLSMGRLRYAIVGVFL